MKNYYNDNDKRAADWLRWLVAHDFIPDGVVDDRSICDVEPGDLAGFTQCHFFAGIGGWPLALELARWAPSRPIWTGSCPCQPFSAAGRREGSNDPRHRWPDFFRLIDACRPAVVVGEQVAGSDGYGWFDGVASDLGAGGYACRAIDFPSAAVDSPQIRQRLYWVAVDGAEGGGLSPAGGKPVQGSSPAQPERPAGGRWASTGRDAYLALVYPDGVPVDLGSAEGRRLALRQFPGWVDGTPARWGDATGADDRNGSWWGGADWIICHDGKARRIAEPIPSCMVDGLSVRLADVRAGLARAALEAVMHYGQISGCDPAEALRAVRIDDAAEALRQRNAGVSVELPTPEVLHDFLQHDLPAFAAGSLGRGFLKTFGFARDGHVRSVHILDGLVHPSCRWRPDEQSPGEPASALPQLSLFLACCAQASRSATDGAHALSIPLLLKGMPGRVPLWSGLGNAINPQAAAEVLIALREAIDAGEIVVP